MKNLAGRAEGASIFGRGQRQKSYRRAHESAFRQIQADNVHAVIFFLRTHGKDRGYTTRIERRRPPPTEPAFDLELLNDDDRQTLVEILNKVTPARH